MTADGDGRPGLRLAMVINWPDLGRWVWDYLPDDGPQADLIFACPDHDDYVAGRGKKPPYLSELYYLARRRPDWRRYDVVFAWELRTALAVALLRGVTGRRPRLVALQPILKGPVLRALPLVRWALSKADRIVYFSRAECQDGARLLGLPPERFTFLPFAWPESVPVSDRDGGYILAFGRSNRDYPLLLEAVRGTGLPVRILAGDLDWAAGLDVPAHVTLLQNLNYDQTQDLAAGASFWVVPLQEAAYASGQSVLVQGMARGKAVVVTDGPGTRDYVRDGETGVLVPPGDAPALRAALQRLWGDAPLRREIGVRAAETARRDFSFAGFARNLLALAEEVVTAPAVTHARRGKR